MFRQGTGKVLPRQSGAFVKDFASGFLQYVTQILPFNTIFMVRCLIIKKVFLPLSGSIHFDRDRFKNKMKVLLAYAVVGGRSKESHTFNNLNEMPNLEISIGAI